MSLGHLSLGLVYKQQLFNENTHPYSQSFNLFHYIILTSNSMHGRESSREMVPYGAQGQGQVCEVC